MVSLPAATGKFFQALGVPDDHVAELAISTSDPASSLTISAGLLYRSLSQQMSAKLGFDAAQDINRDEHLVVKGIANVRVPSTPQFHSELLPRHQSQSE